MRTAFAIFLLKNKISKKKLAEVSLVNRSTLKRWIQGETTPREDSLELVLSALKKLTNKEVTAKDIGLL